MTLIYRIRITICALFVGAEVNAEGSIIQRLINTVTHVYLVVLRSKANGTLDIARLAYGDGNDIHFSFRIFW